MKEYHPITLQTIHRIFSDYYFQNLDHFILLNSTCVVWSNRRMAKRFSTICFIHTTRNDTTSNRLHNYMCLNSLLLVWSTVIGYHVLPGAAAQARLGHIRNLPCYSRSAGHFEGFFHKPAFVNFFFIVESTGSVFEGSGQLHRDPGGNHG